MIGGRFLGNGHFKLLLPHLFIRDEKKGYIALTTTTLGKGSLQVPVSEHGMNRHVLKTICSWQVMGSVSVGFSSKNEKVLPFHPSI